MNDGEKGEDEKKEQEDAQQRVAHDETGKTYDVEAETKAQEPDERK